jgi:hypothetical protein
MKSRPGNVKDVKILIPMISSIARVITYINIYLLFLECKNDYLSNMGDSKKQAKVNKFIKHVKKKFKEN